MIVAEPEILNGERLQALADVCIATRAKLEHHPSHPRMPIALIDDSLSLDPASLQLVRAASIIFVYNEFLDVFFNRIVPKLDHPFVVITNGGDHEFGERFRVALDRASLLRHAFAVNATMVHAKLSAIPIGLGNSHWPHGDTAAVARTTALKLSKKSGIYVNFDVGTNPSVRGPILATLTKNQFAHVVRKQMPGRTAGDLLRMVLGRHPKVRMEEPLAFEAYLTDLAQWSFCASPPGNGVDCHRTWEALYLGVIPVLTQAPIGLLSGLPHIMVDDFATVNERSLDEQRRAMGESLELEKLTLSYWRERITKAAKPS
jgi:hypothetical protein